MRLKKRPVLAITKALIKLMCRVDAAHENLAECSASC